jgi:hypothetical protein
VVELSVEPLVFPEVPELFGEVPLVPDEPVLPDVPLFPKLPAFGVVVVPLAAPFPLVSLIVLLVTTVEVPVFVFTVP